MGIRERIATVFRVFLLFTVLLAVGLLSAITTIRLSIHGRQEVVPNLVGVSVDAAEQVVRSRGLGLKVEDKIFSSQYAANQIVSQMPPAGEHLKLGQHVHVLASLGAPKVAVPNVVGDSLRVARIKAIQRGLNLGEVALVRSTTAAPDQVLVQDPIPGRAEVHSPVVNLLVSLGKGQESFLCPSFLGKPLWEARRTLEKAECKLGAVHPIPTDATPRGTILAQSPAPGSKIAPGTTFSFQVAR